MKQFGVLLLLAALNFFAVEGAFAETGHATAPSDSAHPAIEPAALDILKAASEKLASAKRISFVAHGAFDVPARNGQPLFYHTRSEVLLVRPNKLRVIVPGDGPPSEFYFDGAKVAVFTPRADLIASADAPGSVEQMLAAIYEKAGIYFPFVDFIVADPYKTLTEGLTSAFVIDKSTVVGDTTTNIISICKCICRFGSAQRTSCPGSLAADTSEKPRHVVEFSDWKLDGKAPKDSAFVPHTTASTRQIPFAQPTVAAPAKQ
jgi:hypothetical protein